MYGPKHTYIMESDLQEECPLGGITTAVVQYEWRFREETLGCVCLSIPPSLPPIYPTRPPLRFVGQENMVCILL